MCIWIVGESSSNRNANRDESVETGDEFVDVKTWDKSIKANKIQLSCYNVKLCIESSGKLFVCSREG